MLWIKLEFVTVHIQRLSEFMKEWVEFALTKTDVGEDYVSNTSIGICWRLFLEHQCESG